MTVPTRSHHITLAIGLMCLVAQSIFAQTWYTPMVNSSGQFGPSSTNIMRTNILSGTNIYLAIGTNGEVTVNVYGISGVGTIYTGTGATVRSNAPSISSLTVVDGFISYPNVGQPVVEDVGAGSIVFRGVDSVYLEEVGSGNQNVLTATHWLVGSDQTNAMALSVAGNVRLDSTLLVNGITNVALLPSRFVITGTGTNLVSSSYAESDLLNKVANDSGRGTNTFIRGLSLMTPIGGVSNVFSVMDTNGNIYLQVPTNFSGVVYIGTNAFGRLSISNNASVTNTSFSSGGNAPSLLIDQSGNIGVKTNATAQALEVQGNVNISGNVTNSSSIVTKSGFHVLSGGTTRSISISDAGTPIFQLASTAQLNFQNPGDFNATVCRIYEYGLGTNGLGVSSSAPAGSLFASNILAAGNFGVSATTVAGVGSGSTNYTLMANMGKVYMGSSNVSITAIMGGASGTMQQSSVTITNLSANTWGIQFSAVTNRWRFLGATGQTNSPSVLTNNSALVLRMEIDGTNILCDWEHYVPYP